MTIFEAAVYGLIQGLSEFLPVSSSGHLALLPHIMKIDDPGVTFDLMMHLGTALAVILYFRAEIMSYLKTLKPDLVNLKQGSDDQWFVRNFLWATGVSVAFIVVLMPVSKLARNPWLIVFNLAFFGTILWIADLMNRKSVSEGQVMTAGMQWKLAGFIGLAQSLAIFPGVSRSGITLSVALILGMRRTEAGRFSFLLSLPIIFAGILKEIPDLLKSQTDSSLIVLVTGVLTSFLVGWATIHFFMKLIGKIQLGYFAAYRWLLALLMAWSLS